MNDLREKCAVFGIFGNNDPKTSETAREIYFGLFALQHRGQEHSGIAVTDGKKLYHHKSSGLVSQIYNEEILSKLRGYAGIGHNRYSTSRGNHVDFAQPFAYTKGKVFFGLAHNGNLPSIAKLVEFLKENKEETRDHSDSQLMMQAIGVYMQKGLGLAESITKAYPLFTGAFSCVAISGDSMVAFRDPYGIRPLVLGKKGNDVIVCSETCALDTLGAKFIRDIKPGEILHVFKQNGKIKMTSRVVSRVAPKFDIFEFIYFARYDSLMEGRSVYEVRKNLGRMLARQKKLKIDMVIPVPETAISASIGYAEESGVKLEMGLAKNRYINRTFIEPTQKLRAEKVRMKLSAIREVIRGKRIAIIDDSIVRGTTSKQIVKMLFEAGAKEVHFLVSSAPIRFPDFYGIDTPNQRELIAFNKNTKDICKFLGATSLQYLTIDNMVKATGMPKSRFSMPSFDGVYPLPIYERSLEVSYNIPKD